MAWIAAIISAVAGGAAASKQNAATKKANAAAQAQQADAAGNINAGYGAAMQGMVPYGQLGENAALSLGQLTGTQGYRTAEEQALTKFLNQGPPTLADIQKQTVTIDPSQFNSTGLQGFVDKQARISTLGDALGGVSSYFGHRDRKKAAAAAAAQAAQQAALDKQYQDQLAAAQAKYQTDLAAWNQQKAQLQSASDTSLQNYDPMAVLKSTPGYQDRYLQGQTAVSNTQTGRALGGRAAKEMQQYGQTYASNEYNNEFNRRLQMATMGQNAQTAIGNMSIGQGTNLANINTNVGNLQQQQGLNTSAYYNDLNNVAQQGISNYQTQQNLKTTPTTTTGINTAYDPTLSAYDPNYARTNYVMQ